MKLIIDKAQITHDRDEVTVADLETLRGLLNDLAAQNPERPIDEIVDIAGLPADKTWPVERVDTFDIWSWSAGDERVPLDARVPEAVLVTNINSPDEPFAVEYYNEDDHVDASAAGHSYWPFTDFLGRAKGCVFSCTHPDYDGPEDGRIALVEAPSAELARELLARHPEEYPDGATWDCTPYAAPRSMAELRWTPA